jgi:hypothetical protein
MDVAVAVHRPKYRSLRDPGGCQPGVKREHGAVAGATIWDGYLVALAILVGLRTPVVEHEPPSHVFDIGHVERD